MAVQLESTYIPAAVASARTLFSTLLGWQVDPQIEERSDEFMAGLDISGIIGFSGLLRGTIVISFEQGVTFAAVQALLGETPTEITSDVCDTVAELANMIAGGVKDHVRIEEIALGMPTTVSGHGHTIVFDTGAEVERVSFATPAGKVLLQIAVRGGS
jgi:chemotaxis protein CheX